MSNRKSYLNNAERNEFCALVSFKAVLEKRIEAWGKVKSIEKDQIKWAKMSLAFIKKTLDEIIKPLDKDSLRRLYKLGTESEIVVKPKAEAIREVARLLETDEVVPLKNRDFLELCFQAQLTCATCEIKEWQECTYRKIFVEYDVDPLTKKEACNETCPYSNKTLAEEALCDLVEMESSGDFYRVKIGMRPTGFKLVKQAPLDKMYWELPKITSKY